MATKDRSLSAALTCGECSRLDIKSRGLCNKCYQRNCKLGLLHTFPTKPLRVKSHCTNHPLRFAIAKHLCDSCYRVKHRSKPAQRLRLRTYDRERNKRLREQAIAILGGCCSCCGYLWLPALCIDHKQGDGSKRRRGGEPVGDTLYLGIISGVYTKDNFQILCANCNMAKGTKAKCPHAIEV